MKLLTPFSLLFLYDQDKTVLQFFFVFFEDICYIHMSTKSLTALTHGKLFYF